MYTIGLIDDESNQLSQIRRTIKTNAPANIEFDFKNYELNDDISNLIENVFQDVIKDISEGTISSLIIDYKIMIRVTKIEGTDILKLLQKIVPQFPAVLLTDVIDDCVAHDFVDPDKVYKKSEFFKLECEYSKGKVANLFRNMNRYLGNKVRLEIQRKKLKNELVESIPEQRIYDELIETESRLGEYVPIENSQIDKVFDASKMKDIIELLEKADKLAED